LTPQDDGGEVISKRVLDWLAGVGAIATLLATIFGLFLDNAKNAQLYAFGVAILLAVVSSGVYFYQRRRAAKLKIAESLEPLSATASLRGLLPFEEGDQLPGRGRDVQELYTLVASSSFRFGVLWGESGCGKTSLLRAGLVPKLRNEKFSPLYLNKPTNSPQEAIRSVLLKEVPNLEKQTSKSLNQLLKSAAPKGKKIVVLFDQFEEFFLTHRTPKSRAAFIKWLGETIADENVPVVFLIGIRADFFAQLHNFSPEIPEPTSTHTTYQLKNFDTEQAKQIFSAAAKADGIPFELELIQAVIRELEVEEFIRPAELQVVGTRLKRKNVFTLNRYEALGGARGILSSYISDEIKQSPNEQIARLILRLMCADTVEIKSPTDLSMNDILHAISNGEQTANQQPSNRQEIIQAILNQFVAARVLIHTDDDKYNLAHDYLATYVHTATEGTETSTERANRMLKRYVAEYKEDPRTRIPFARAHWIQKYASADLASSEKSKELIKKSKTTFYSRLAGIVSALLLLVTVLYGFTASSYYVSFESFTNPDVAPHLVIVSGYPPLKFLPGFDKIAIQTDFNVNEWSRSSPQGMEELAREQVTGYWFQKTESGYEVWGEQLIERLSPLSQARTRRWLGQFDIAVRILVDTIEDPVVPSYERSSAITSLVLLAQNEPEIITGDTVQSLIEGSIDPQLNSNARSAAIQTIGQLAMIRPDIIPADTVQVLIDIFRTPREDHNARFYAAEAFGQVASAKPETITADTVQTLMEVFTNPQSDYNARYYATQGFSHITQTKPETIEIEIVQGLIDIFTDPQSDQNMRALIVQSFSQIAQNKSTAIASEMFNLLIDMFSDPQVPYDRRLYAAQVIGQIAQAEPETITRDIVQALVDTFSNPQVDYPARSFAVQSLGQVTQAKSTAISSETIQLLTEILGNSQADSSARTFAAQILGQVSKAKPELITMGLGQSLIDIFSDPEADSYLRSLTVQAFGSVAQTNPKLITADIMQTLLDILSNSQTDSALSSSVAEAFGQVVQVRPELITADTVQSLIEILVNLEAGQNERNAAIQVFGYAIQAKPELISADTAQTLIHILNETQTDPNFRSMAAQALGQMVQAEPEIVFADMEQTLIDTFSNPLADYNARSFAGLVLSRAAQAKPGMLSTDTVQTLIEIFSNPQADDSLRFSAISAFQQVLQVKPEMIASDTVQTLVNIFHDPQANYAVRSSAAQILSQVSKVKPQMITPDIAETLIEIFNNPRADFNLRYLAMDTLGQAAQSQDTAISSGMIQSLMDVFSNSQIDYNLRSYAANTFGKVAEAHPEIITTDTLQKLIDIFSNPQVDYIASTFATQAFSQIIQAKSPTGESETIQLLIDTFSNPQADYNARFYTAQTLGQAAQAKPEMITSTTIKTLVDIFSNPQTDPDARSYAAKAFAQAAQARPKAVPSELTQTLINLLKANLDSFGRSSAAYALFGIALGDTEKESAIRKELEDMQTHPQLHQRIASSRTLEMFDILDLLHRVRENPDQLESIKSKLNTLSYLYDEEHIQFATQIILQEINKIETANQE
jgi:HEAT repeat protein